MSDGAEDSLERELSVREARDKGAFIENMSKSEQNSRNDLDRIFSIEDALDQFPDPLDDE